MSQKIKEFFTKIFPTILLTTLMVGAIVYAWQEPTQPPPSGNVPAPINVGGSTQLKSGALGIGGLFETFAETHLAVPSQKEIKEISKSLKVGIGTRNPETVLDVAGDLRIGGLINQPSYSLILGVGAVDSYGPWEPPTGQQQPINDTCDGKQDEIYTCPPETIQECTDAYRQQVNPPQGTPYYLYWGRAVTCVKDSSIYKIRNAFGTIQFINSGDSINLVLGQDGNVGIGTTAPGYKLEIAGALRLQPTNTIPTAAPGVIYYNSTSNTFKCYQNNQWVDCIGGGTGGGMNGTPGTIAKFTSPTTIGDSIIYEKSGRVPLLDIFVGIGTTNPTSKLDVVGNIKATTGNIQALNNATNNWFYQYRESLNGHSNPRCNEQGTNGAVNCDIDPTVPDCNTGGEPILGDPGLAPQVCYDWATWSEQGQGEVDVQRKFEKIQGPVFGGWVSAMTGYGDTISIGGDTGGDDLEIKIIAPRSRNLVSLWNRHSEVNDLSNLQLKELYARGKVNTPRVESDFLLLKPFTPDGSPPPALNGTIYYDAILKKFRCYQNNQWVDCVGGGAGGGFWTQTGNNLYPSNSGWNVGIGTTNPVTKLHVEGTSGELLTVKANGYYFFVGANRDNGDYVDIGAYYQSGQQGGWKNLILNRDGGNVGIGTTTVEAKLNVLETSTNSRGVQIFGSDRRKLFLVPNLSEGGYNPLSQNNDFGLFYTEGNMNTGNLVIGPWSNNSAGIRITNLGNVGIGATAPNQKLSIVNGNVALVDGNIYLSNTEYCVPGGGWYYTRNLVNIPDHQTDYPRCSCDQNDAIQECPNVFPAGNQTAAYCYDWWRYESGYPRSDKYKREYYSSSQCMWTPPPQIHFTDLETPAWTYTLKNKVGTLQFISGMDPNTPRLTIGADGTTTIWGNLETALHTYRSSNLPSGWGGGVNTWDVVAQSSIAARRICLDSNPNTTNTWELNCIESNWPMGYWTQSGSNLYTNNTGWNVGIGTTNPEAKLHITNGTSGTVTTELKIGYKNSQIIAFDKRVDSTYYNRPFNRLEINVGGSSQGDPPLITDIYLSKVGGGNADRIYLMANEIITPSNGGQLKILKKFENYCSNFWICRVSLDPNYIPIYVEGKDAVYGSTYSKTSGGSSVWYGGGGIVNCTGEPSNSIICTNATVGSSSWVRVWAIYASER